MPFRPSPSHPPIKTGQPLQNTHHCPHLDAVKFKQPSSRKKWDWITKSASIGNGCLSEIEKSRQVVSSTQNNVENVCVRRRSTTKLILISPAHYTQYNCLLVAGLSTGQIRKPYTQWRMSSRKEVEHGLVSEANTADQKYTYYFSLRQNPVINHIFRVTSKIPPFKDTKKVHSTPVCGDINRPNVRD